MVMNLVDRSPARGWRNTERKAFVDRGAPDLVLGLALVHHLAIAANVLLPQIIEWFRSFGATRIVHDRGAPTAGESEPDAVPREPAQLIHTGSRWPFERNEQVGRRRISRDSLR